jgi:hypothetical protein
MAKPVATVAFMALTEVEKADLIDNQFVYDGTDFVRHLPCDTGVYLGEPEDVQKALAHLTECPKPNGPAGTFHGNRPWPKGSPAQEATKEKWLAQIAAHPNTTDEDYDAAVTMLVDPSLPVEAATAARLQAAGLVIVNSNGSCVPNVW